MSPKIRKALKLVSAGIGGSALVAAGALSMAGAQQPSAPPALLSSTMSTGVTVTEVTPATVLATSVAVPAIKGPAKFSAK